MRSLLSKRILVPLLILLMGLIPSTIFGQIIISQVYNGTGNDKCIEITNIGFSDVNLASPIQYKIGLWATPGNTGNASLSGSPTVFTNLTGTLRGGYKCVVSNVGSTAPIFLFEVLNIVDNNVTTFDGNDAIAIFKDTDTLLDSFGTGINYNAISYERQEGFISATPSFNSSKWIPKTLAEVASATGQNNTILGLHYYDGDIITITGALASLSTTYGTPSAATSVGVTVESHFYPRSPFPPGLTPMTGIVPFGFEACRLAEFFFECVRRRNYFSCPYRQ